MNKTKSPCSREEHRAVRASADRWEALVFAGYQGVEAGDTEDEPEEILELRHCPCGSTLAKRVAEFWR